MTQSKTQFLDRAYDLDSPEAVREFYDEWSKTYDSNIVDDNGYVTPRRCAEALARRARPESVVLDIGCGTGLSGLALHEAGFQTIDGFDLSPDMLAKAAEKKVYRDLQIADITQKLPYADESYTALNACGVFGQQHTPPSGFADMLKLLKPDHCFSFSLNDHTYENDDYAYPKAVDAAAEAGTIDILEKEYGDHLPGIDLRAWVYVVRKNAGPET
ncbi:MAG: methyltransferase domain-containing protein [Pseudomonadota bacterium]